MALEREGSDLRLSLVCDEVHPFHLVAVEIPRQDSVVVLSKKHKATQNLTKIIIISEIILKL